MKKNRIVTAYRKVFDKKPTLSTRTDNTTSMALCWLLGTMGVNLTTDDPSFHIEYGYVFSPDLKQNIDNNVNQSHEFFSNEDLSKINIIRNSLEQYKQDSLKQQVLQATACYSFLKQLANDYVITNEMGSLCPHYQALIKQAKITYNYIQNQHKLLNKNNYDLE